MRLLQVLGNDQIERLTDSLRGAVTEQGGGGIVPQHDGTGSVSVDNRIGGLFEDQSGRQSHYQSGNLSARSIAWNRGSLRNGSMRGSHGAKPSPRIA
jgi:hypothetical protein